MSATATGIREARRRLVEEHLGLVRQVAARVRLQLDAALPSDELEAYGREALVRASRRWDPGRGVPFGAYARQVVRGGVLDGVAELGGVSRRHYRRLCFDRSAADVLAGWTRTPAEPMGATEVLAALHTAFLLASEATGDWGYAAGDHERQLGQRTLRARLVAALQRLPERQRSLILGVYWEGRSFSDAGRQVGLSAAQASRVHQAALHRLRAALGLGRAA